MPQANMGISYFDTKLHCLSTLTKNHIVKTIGKKCKIKNVNKM